MDQRALVFLWFSFVFAVELSIAVVGIVRGYNFVQIIGLLASTFSFVLTVGVLAALAFYSLSILLEGSKTHRQNCEEDDINPGFWA
jgi:hypothetical protein